MTPTKGVDQIFPLMLALKWPVNIALSGLMADFLAQLFSEQTK